MFGIFFGWSGQDWLMFYLLCRMWGEVVRLYKQDAFICFLCCAVLCLFLYSFRALINDATGLTSEATIYGRVWSGHSDPACFGP